MTNYRVVLDTETYPYLAKNGLALQVSGREDGQDTSSQHILHFKPDTPVKIPPRLYEAWCGPLNCDPNNVRDMEKLENAIRRVFPKAYFKEEEYFNRKFNRMETRKKMISVQEFVPVLKLLSAEEYLESVQKDELDEAEYAIDYTRYSHKTLKSMAKDELVRGGMENGEANRVTMGMTIEELIVYLETGELSKDEPVSAIKSQTD